MGRRYLVPHLYFALLTFLLGPSLILHFGEAPVSDTFADPAQTQWNLWWVGRVLNSHFIGVDTIPSHDGFFHSTAIFYPVGASLAWHTLDLCYGLLLWPLQPVVGVLGQHALALLLATYLTAWAAWEAARAIGCREVGAAAACAAITLHGYRLAEAHHLNIFSSFFFLATFVLLVRLRSDESRRWSVLALGALAWPTIFSSQFHALGCALLAVGFCVGVLVVDGGEARWRFFRRTLVAALVAAPAAILMLWILHAAGTPPRFGSDAQAANAADVWQFLIHPRIRMALAGVDDTTPWGMLYRAETWYLPGYLLTAAMALAAVRLRSRRMVLLALGATVFFLLSMGPWLKLGTPGTINPEPLGFPMPGMLLSWVPGLGTVRSVWHFGFLGTMLAAIGGAWGLEQMLAAWKLDKHPLVAILIPLVVTAETQVGAILTTEPTLQASAHVLAEKREGGAVVCLPHLSYEIRGMYMAQQTIHGRPIVAGYISRDPAAFDEWKDQRLWPGEFEAVGIGARQRISLQADLNLREDIARHELGWFLVDIPLGASVQIRDRMGAELRRLGYTEQEIAGGSALLVRLRRNAE
ncbi:hypothetical protein GC173_08485 [bacterium]|nr:hypothetical protein [bacterium]